MKIHVIKPFYTWIDIIRFYTHKKTMPLLEEDVNAMYPTEISLKNKTNSGIFRVILMLYENLFFALLYSSRRRFYEYYILYRE